VKHQEDEDMEYRQCPYCDKLFEQPTGLRFVRIGAMSPFDEHIESVHKKVKVWKGRNAKWIDKAEAERRFHAKDVDSRDEKSKASQRGKSNAKNASE
jgi:hypothetical protein